MIQLRDFDPANYLSDEEAIAHYLADAAADPDPDAFLQALGDVARARVSEPLPKDRFGAHEPLPRDRAGSQPELPDVAPGDGRAGSIVDGPFQGQGHGARIAPLTQTKSRAAWQSRLFQSGARGRNRTGTPCGGGF